ncbi:MAG: T9SS type A sorting domain-containing protein, partial [bacterium]|nr:T9SS type A sorting domain-containing protein [Candidatus Kapabacteria bacterium]
TDTLLPHVLYTAMHHPREPAGMMSLMYSMWTMLENYGIDPEVTHLLDTRSLWFVPLVNPDGYARNIQTAPTGGGLWRKNMRADGDSGVDLNRNYGPIEFWNHPLGGSSTNRQSEIYRGPAPFSEPETQAIRDFCLEHRFVVALNHHTYSNLFIQPEELVSLTPADSVYYKVATRALASLAGFAPGNTKITVGYTTRGAAEDWMYAFGRGAQEHTFSWTPESGNASDEFWPAPSRIEPICEASHRMNVGLAWSAAAAPMITARTWRPSAGGPRVRVTVANVGRKPMTSTASLQLTDGSPTIVPALSPGEALHFELPVAASLTSNSMMPRATVGIALTYENVAQHDTISPIAHHVDTLFADNFETDLSRWISSAGWGIERSQEGDNVASDSPNKDYVEQRGDNILETIQPVSLAGHSAAELLFDASYAVEARNHNAMVQIRRANSLLWEDVDAEELQLSLHNASPIRNRFRGDGRAWRRYRMSLDDYLGDEISIRFVVTAVNSQFHYTFDGLKIDDVEVVASRPINADVAADAHAHSVLVLPNPFTSRLTVQADVAHGETVIELHDALGRIVRSIDGVARATFDTNDLPAGAYTVVVRRDSDVVRRRVVLAK